MRNVIGIDAGGTKTLGILADENGQVLAQMRAGGANLRVHGELAVEKVLYQVLEGLELPGSPAAGALCLGMAGVGRAQDREVIEGVLRRLGRKQHVRVVNDAYVALAAGAESRTGIALVAGTGSIAYGVDSSGKSARSGGWGFLLGDEGSAFWLGHAAVRAGIRAADGRGPKTQLFDRICQDLGVSAPAELIDWFYDQELARYRVARLAPLVEECASQGDETAFGLLDQAAFHLTQAAQAVARELHFEGRYPVVLSGGAYKACPSLASRVETRLDLPADIVRLLVEPAVGAVRLAVEMLT